MKGTKAIVSGHSRGLGAAIAGELLERGIPVLGLARRGNAELAAEHGDRLAEVVLDLGDSAALAAWLAGSALGDWVAGAEQVLLVNNAGTLQPMGPLPLQDAAAVARGVAVNVAAPLMLAAAIAQVSAAVGEGTTGQVRDRRVLHISSGAARKPYAGWSVYCATKAALDHHARAVQVDATPGLRICALAPGVVDTAMQGEIRASTLERFPLRDRFAEMQASGGLIAPAECAMHLVDFLLDEDFGREPVADLRELMR
ncbi:SDR family oxidoreductase [Thauera sp.]|jgi:NAD(P)-dependent dehydrogenase (short-subunit alcohol dehydrogenase family)|uniref:SDR family oxidoreductase n=1 Tax=Thauera sp. TaxID=1905334 RepID=UPI002A359D39|nr:SDR family oxidoreductase [Thauera sp.]MDX9885507.1 SDR family oxidoreductase [Thauera sp.]